MLIGGFVHVVERLSFGVGSRQCLKARANISFLTCQFCLFFLVIAFRNTTDSPQTRSLRRFDSKTNHLLIWDVWEVKNKPDAIEILAHIPFLPFFLYNISMAFKIHPSAAEPFKRWNIFCVVESIFFWRLHRWLQENCCKKYQTLFSISQIFCEFQLHETVQLSPAHLTSNCNRKF